MERFFKENLVTIVGILAVAIFIGAYLVYNTFNETKRLKNDIIVATETLNTNKQKLEELEQQKAQTEKAPEEKVSRSNKVIYEVLGQQFSPEASFGIMFENLLSNMTSAGIRIRSIEYNYHPTEDRILATNVPGYNACELSFTTVGTYSQLQNFFKSIVKQNYITNIYEIYIEPYRKDKTILIAKFKVRLYTKTI